MSASEVHALQEAVRQLHDFIVDQLDSDPGPVEDYLTDDAAKAAARRAMELRPIRYLGLVQPGDDGMEQPWRP